MNKKEFRAAMARYGESGTALAKAMGITPQTLSRKLNDAEADFTQGEMLFIKERYSLSAEEMVTIFFNQEVS